MDLLKRFTPNKFLFKYPLQKGANIVGIIMCSVSIICIIVFLVHYFRYRKAENCTETILHDVYSFCWNAMIYCACMFVVHLWFIRGVEKQKSSVVLSWVVITTMWWLQSACFLLIMLLVNIENIGFSWFAGLCFAIVAILIIGYSILIGYGYWLEIKDLITIHETATQGT